MQTQPPQSAIETAAMDDELEAIVPPLLGLDDDSIDAEWDAMAIEEILPFGVLPGGDAWPEDLF